MKKFGIFFGICSLLLLSVLAYAQSKRKNEVVIDAPTYIIPKGEVLGAEDNKNPQKQQTSITIKIDKNPVYLYWPQKITIETIPNAEVRMKVTYPNGSINNSGTKSGYSNSKGIFENKWSITGKKDILGQAKVELTVGDLENYSTAQSTFEITTYKKPTPTTTPTPSIIQNEPSETAPPILPSNSP